MTAIERITTDSDRLTADDRLRVRLGVCARMTAYGLPWSTHCDVLLSATERERGQIECTEHETDLIENYPGSPVPRLAEPDRVAEGCWIAVDRLPTEQRIIRAVNLVQPATEQISDDGPYWSLSYTPHNVLAMGGRWYEVAPHGARNIGTLAGVDDAQTGDAWARRYGRPMTDGAWAVIEDAYYVRAATTVVNRLTMIACRDLRDPQGTQLYGQVATEDVTDAVECTDEGLRVRCDAVDPAAFGWDGTLDG
jgi:hypothetical protein